MEYEVIISVYEKGNQDAEPVREEILLETADLGETDALVEDVLDLCGEEDDEEDTVGEVDESGVITAEGGD